MNAGRCCRYLMVGVEFGGAGLTAVLFERSSEDTTTDDEYRLRHPCPGCSSAFDMQLRSGIQVSA
jgi:hypothetical protein